MLAIVKFNQIDMKNSSHPIQNITKVFRLEVKGENDVLSTIQLGPNEFVNYDDYFGLFNQDPEPHNYLAVEKESYSSNFYQGRP